MKKIFTVTLDMKRAVSNREFEVVDGDNGNVLTVTLTDNGAPVDLSGCSVLAVFSHSNGVASQSSVEGGGVTIGGEDNNVVTIDLFTPSFSPGMVECELQVYSQAGEGGESTLITSAKFNFKCRRGIFNEDTLPSTPEYSVLGGLIKQVNDAIFDVKALVDAVGSVHPHAANHLSSGSDPLTLDALGAAAPSRDFSCTLTAEGWTGVPNMPKASLCEYSVGTYTLTMPDSFDPALDDCVALDVDEPCNTISAELYDSASNSAGYITSSGSITARASNFATDYIEVDPAKTYMYSGFGSNYASSYVAFYTSTHTFLTGAVCSSFGESGTLEVPETAAYVRFTLYTSYVSTFSLKTYQHEPVLIAIGDTTYLVADENDAPLMPDWAADDAVVLELSETLDPSETYPLAYVSTEEYQLVAPYTQSASVDGITAADAPLADVMLSEDPLTMLDELTSWARISDIHTVDGGIDALCLVSPPHVALELKLKVVD